MATRDEKPVSRTDPLLARTLDAFREWVDAPQPETAVMSHLGISLRVPPFGELIVSSWIKDGLIHVGIKLGSRREYHGGPPILPHEKEAWRDAVATRFGGIEDEWGSRVWISYRTATRPSDSLLAARSRYVPFVSTTADLVQPTPDFGPPFEEVVEERMKQIIGEVV